MVSFIGRAKVDNLELWRALQDPLEGRALLAYVLDGVGVAH